MAKRFVATCLVHARFHIVRFEVISILPTCATLVGVYLSVVCREVANLKSMAVTQVGRLR